MDMWMGTIRMDDVAIAKAHSYTDIVLLERIDVDNTGDGFYALVREQKLVYEP